MCTKFERFIIEEEIVNERKTLKELRENGEVSTRLLYALRRGFYNWQMDNCETTGGGYYSPKRLVNEIHADDCTIEYLYNTMGEAYLLRIRNLGPKTLAELKSLI